MRAKVATAPPLWMDVTSLKAPAMAAFEETAVEAVGLHPMCAPPLVTTLHGRVLVVCENPGRRVTRWSGWADQFLDQIGGRQVRLTADRHDRLMALVQAGCHAGWLAQARLWSQTVPELGGLDKLLAVRTPSFALLEKAVCRILSGNPELYADIQLQNPEVPATLRLLADGLNEMADTVASGDRAALISKFLAVPRAALGAADGNAALVSGNAAFERLSHLLADLDEPHPLVFKIVTDRPGTLAEVLSRFAAAEVNLTAIQSVRAKDGIIRFHLCLDRPAADPVITAVVDELTAAGIIMLS